MLAAWKDHYWVSRMDVKMVLTLVEMKDALWEEYLVASMVALMVA